MEKMITSVAMIPVIFQRVIVFFIVENLVFWVFWARSEAVGYAVKRVAKNPEFSRQNSE
jgi:hypothetical protein